MLIAVAVLIYFCWPSKPKFQIDHPERLMQADIREIKLWIRFFGIIAIISMIIGVIVALG